jgi:hypothetical protein
MGWNWRLRTTAITGLLFIPRVNVSGEPWWWCRLVITLELSTRARWQSYQQRLLKRVGGIDEGVRIMCIQCLWYVNGSFTCRKILRHGTSGFTYHPKEGAQQIFIALKNPSPRPGLKPRLLGSVASTLTTTLLRRLWFNYDIIKSKIQIMKVLITYVNTVCFFLILALPGSHTQLIFSF